MFHVSYFTALPNDAYGDCGRFMLKQEHRPMVGDLVPTNVIRRNDPPWDESGDAGIDKARNAVETALRGARLLQVEHVLYAGNNVFHAYCVAVATVDPGHQTTFGGKRGDLAEILYHYIEQANSFYETYAKEGKP